MYRTFAIIDGTEEVVLHKNYDEALQYKADATADGAYCEILQVLSDNSDALQRAA